MTRRAPVTAYVLDTWPIMAFFGDEPAAEAVEQLMANAHAQGVPLLMTLVNVAEVWYNVARQISSQTADERLAQLRELGIQFISVDEPLALQAARLKAKYKMSLADCFAAALAQQRTGDVVTGDQDFKQAEPAVRVAWVN